MSLKVVLADDTAYIPTQTDSNNGGYNLYASQDTVIQSQSRSLVETNVRVGIPNRCSARLIPSANLNLRSGIHVGSVVIDADFRGTIQIVIFNLGQYDFVVSKGDTLAQLIIEKTVTPEIEQVDNLPIQAYDRAMERGTGEYYPAEIAAFLKNPKRGNIPDVDDIGFSPDDETQLATSAELFVTAAAMVIVSEMKTKSHGNCTLCFQTLGYYKGTHPVFGSHSCSELGWELVPRFFKTVFETITDLQTHVNYLADMIIKSFYNLLIRSFGVTNLNATEMKGVVWSLLRNNHFIDIQQRPSCGDGYQYVGLICKMNTYRRAIKSRCLLGNIVTVKKGKLDNDIQDAVETLWSFRFGTLANSELVPISEKTKLWLSTLYDATNKIRKQRVSSPRLDIAEWDQQHGPEDVDGIIENNSAIDFMFE